MSFETNILIVEDRKEVSDLITELIHKQDHLKLIGTASTVKDAIALITSLNPQIVLLDVELPDGNSFDILKKVDHSKFKVIFITSHEDYAIEAFNYSAIDYMLKPINIERFYNAISKAQQNLKLENQEYQIKSLLHNIQNKDNFDKKIILNTSNSIHLIQVKNIIRCEADESYTSFFLVNGEKIVVSKKLIVYEKMLQGTGFMRIHRSHLINLSQVNKFDKKNNKVVLSDGSSVPISTQKRENLLAVLTNKINFMGN